MQKVLSKRIIRDLKENLVRYLALGALIILCMYIIISLIGTAETIISGSDAAAKRNHLEDGQFSVFVPLLETEQKELESKGIILEEQFYLDYVLEDESTLRVFKNREKINLLETISGRMAAASDEVVLERRYCDEHEISVGDTIMIGGNTYRVVGIGCTPDYDAVYKNFTDSSINSMEFGTAFITETAYEQLLTENKSVKAEEYVYTYLLNDAMTHEELNTTLENLKVPSDSIEDIYFQEYWEELLVDKVQLMDGMDALQEGSAEIAAGLTQLTNINTGIPALDDGIVKARDGANELTNGVETLRKETDQFLEEYFEIEISNLQSFIKVDDNPRAGAAAGDQLINKFGGILAGCIILVLFAYVISVFVVYGIEKENTTIGALYALGVKRRELILHYLCLPVVITFISGAIGCTIGFLFIGESTIIGNVYGYFSIPDMPDVYPPYLIVYGLVLPPVLSALVNWLVIRKKLTRPALQMLRNEQNQEGFRQLKLGKMGFVTAFRIRQMLREARTSLTVVCGMFISLLILMLGLNCYSMCTRISNDNRTDTKFEYLYTYKYPEATVPVGGYEAFSKGVKKENLGYNLDVTILGITEENPFFDVELTDSKSEVVISSAMAEKYGLKSGEVFVVEDEEAKMHYAFTVKDIAQYSTSFYIFMDIDCMRDMFGKNEDYYNQVFSEKELNIAAGRLYGVTTKQDIEKAADVFIVQMRPMITMMLTFSSLIFAVVMYLMLKVMIDRSAFHISMVKVFGYRTKEIKKLYLNGNFYVIAVGALLCIPLAKKCIDLAYPFMVSNVSCSMNLTFTPTLYVSIYVGVILIYLVINRLLVGKLNRVNLAEVLKNRE